MKKLIECVPNFSEGRDQNVIRQITDAIESVDGVSLLDVDPGASTNRTVVTFVGDPDATVEAAFRGIRKAAELIDMRKQKGAHPRMGATDVCPFIPVSNVSWEEAFDVREQGRAKTQDGTPSGKTVLDADGEPVRIPGMLKHVKGIGWFVKEYGLAQVSMNLTNIEQTPLHAAFDACVESAAKRGLRVTGSEIVGMLPKKSLLDAARHFLRKQQWSQGASEEELIEIAVRSMGLGELKPFIPKEKVIELKIESAESRQSWAKLNVRE